MMYKTFNDLHKGDNLLGEYTRARLPSILTTDMFTIDRVKLHLSALAETLDKHQIFWLSVDARTEEAFLKITSSTTGKDYIWNLFDIQQYNSHSTKLGDYKYRYKLMFSLDPFRNQLDKFPDSQLHWRAYIDGVWNTTCNHFISDIKPDRYKSVKIPCVLVEDMYIKVP